MISAENDNCVFVQSTILERLEKLSDAIVNVGYGTVVCSASALDLVWSKLLVPEIADFEETLGVGILLILGNGYFWKDDIDIFVHVPVFLLDGVRVMRVGEGNGHAEWSSGWTFADMVIKELLTPIFVSDVDGFGCGRRTCT